MTAVVSIQVVTAQAVSYRSRRGAFACREQQVPFIADVPCYGAAYSGLSRDLRRCASSSSAYWSAVVPPEGTILQPEIAAHLAGF